GIEVSFFYAKSRTCSFIALNTKNIASSAFKLGGRDNFNEVRVFQQERDGIRKFNNKGIVVYKR
ncbi:MAG: hypothetical protein ACLSEP_12170, partial [Mediterraneibacter gnavus]